MSDEMDKVGEYALLWRQRAEKAEAQVASLEAKVKENQSVSSAMGVLIEALQSDPGYRLSWQANIAMAFKDEYACNNMPDAESKGSATIHEISNNAADNFLAMLAALRAKMEGE